ncbi:hypothetical protein AWZ03_003729 [Drosophila navojoa]|uniref:Sema domain-containing protein n=1 Tax=Drosophila navojoa TaxID=7232 RepID=A0A484BMF3_DRONA|nr:hypothetical protein AWZ03_003729 [Drosophila navojoa]
MDTLSPLLPQCPEDILKFLGNESVVDHFKLVTKDGNSLLIGARNTVFNLSIHDLTEQQSLVWSSPEEDTKMCLMKGKDEEACQNYIRIMVVPSPGRLFVCGTNSFRPMCNTYVINESNYTLEATKNGQAVCPYDPRHNSTSVLADAIKTLTNGDMNDGRRVGEGAKCQGPVTERPGKDNAD